MILPKRQPILAIQRFQKLADKLIKTKLVNLLGLAVITFSAQGLRGEPIDLTFVNHERFPLYNLNEPVFVEVSSSDHEAHGTQLSWQVDDWNSTEVGRGTLTVSTNPKNTKTILSLPSFGLGYFSLHLYSSTGVSLIAAKGSRPAGYVSYGVLLPRTRRPFESGDDSRFGAQGTNFILTGKFMSGDPVAPVYPTLGAEWTYIARKPWELCPTSSSNFHPVLMPDTFRKQASFESRAGLCLIVDAHGVPLWLQSRKPSKSPDTQRNISSEQGQEYPPSDYQTYEEIIGKIAAEQNVRRRTLFPYQANNYYQIHWEPDWHYKGTDSEFISMYAHARAAILKNDPAGRLLGPNFGEIRSGNIKLRKLFQLGIGKYLDGVITHCYPAVQGTDPDLNGMSDDVSTLVHLTHEYLPETTRIISSEWGVDWGTSPPTKDEDSLRLEASRVVRGHVVILGEGINTTFFFYTADTSEGLGGGLLFNTSLSKQTYGATSVEPKPVFLAAAVTTRLLDGSVSRGKVKFLAANSVGYEFENTSQIIYCIWSLDAKKSTISVPTSLGVCTAFDLVGRAERNIGTAGTFTIPITTFPTWIVIEKRLHSQRGEENP